MQGNNRIAVIGGGSWGTALVKLLLNNVDNVNWWVRREDTAQHIKQFKRNPNYLTYTDLNTDKLNITTNLSELVKESDILIFTIPAAFLKHTIDSEGIKSFKDKIIVSGIKGIVPETSSIVADYFHNYFDVDYNNIGIIAGPCHSEEVVMQKLSYLTIAFQQIEKAEYLANKLSCRYLKPSTTNDIIGTEYAAVLKNIFAIANGICIGLGYGDNFQAVLIVNAMQEISRFISKAHPRDRDINASYYTGDLIVTAYSKFSRNRMFGNMIGKGYSVKSTIVEMKMVAEGYYAVKSFNEINKRFNVYMPIAEAVFNIIYNNKSPNTEIKLLADKLS